MKLSRVDEEILKVIVGFKVGIGCYEIARRLNKDPAFIHRRLAKIQLNGNYLVRINSKPALYKFDFRKEKELINKEAKCPKCYHTQTVHYQQLTVICSNPECFTRSGNKTRYYITKERISKYEKVILI